MDLGYVFMPANALVIGFLEIGLSLRRALSLSEKVPRRGQRLVERAVLWPVIIQLDRPDLIEKEVSQFIQQIRGGTQRPSNYGSTVTE